MSNYFKDFMQPVKIIFNRLNQQNNKRIFVTGNDGIKIPITPTLPISADLPEYPCKLIRDAGGKVNEIQYGESSTGYVWRQLLVRFADGKIDKIIQENPDGSFNIVLHRGLNNKIELIDLD